MNADPDPADLRHVDTWLFDLDNTLYPAESGLMSICGPQGGDPTKYGVAIVDVCTGMLASNSILAALNAQSTEGERPA